MRICRIAITILRQRHTCGAGQLQAKKLRGRRIYLRRFELQSPFRRDLTLAGVLPNGIVPDCPSEVCHGIVAPSNEQSE